jgi:predicted esterase
MRIGKPLSLKVQVYKAATAGDHPELIVVLHGDAPGGPPRYQYRFAEALAKRAGNAVVAAILRPGYSDGEDKSDGERGLTTGDNYTPEVLDAVTSAIEALKRRYGAEHLLLVGHSGGAAISADLLGRQAAGAKAAVLVSCPCDLPEWRRHMRAKQGNAIWGQPVTSLSPLDQVGGIAGNGHVWMIVGAADDVAPPPLTEAYADAVRQRDIAVEVIVAPGLEHDILLEPVVMDLVLRAAGAVERSHQ